jgi:hypothetical protein
VYEVADILGDLDNAEDITDLELLGYAIIEYAPETWAVQITVNNVEPAGSVTCLYIESNAHDVDLRIYD